MALNDSQISMIRGGADTDVPEDEADAAARTRKIACCSCCKATKCNTKKNGLVDDETLLD